MKCISKIKKQFLKTLKDHGILCMHIVQFPAEFCKMWVALINFKHVFTEKFFFICHEIFYFKFLWGESIGIHLKNLFWNFYNRGQFNSYFTEFYLEFGQCLHINYILWKQNCRNSAWNIDFSRLLFKNS